MGWRGQRLPGLACNNGGMRKIAKGELKFWGVLVVVGVVLWTVFYMLFVRNWPYVIEGPGPTLNVLGNLDGKQLITVNGQEDKPEMGQLRMVTVSLRGGPGHQDVKGLELIRAWTNPAMHVERYDRMYPKDETAEQEMKIQRQYMESSMDSARAAALTYLHQPFEARVTVVGVSDKSDAKGKLQADDRILWLEVNGKKTAIKSTAELYAVAQSSAPGTVLNVGFERDGEERQTQVQTIAAPPGRKGSLLGVFIRADYKFPDDIKISVGDNIGGPSAGTMFTLGIISRLTHQDLAGDQVIAGTGTMSPSGEVGPIGGIVQKVYGAQRDGAKWFLAPTSNCGDFKNQKLPEGIKIVAMSDVNDAVNAVKQIAAGQGEHLKGCE